MANVFQQNKRRNLFENTKPLDPEITPSIDDLVRRDKQIEKLVHHLKDLIHYGTAPNLHITGDTGVGKTATTKSVLNDLEEAMENEGENFEPIYITDVDNERNALQKIAGKLEVEYYNPGNLTRYYDKIGEKLVEDDIVSVLVIDEADKLFKRKRKDHGNSLFKRLSEVRNQVNSENEGYLLLIAITNNARLVELFNPRVESRFGRETIAFPSYDAPDLREILETRAEKAYKPDVIADGVLSKTAALVAQNNGDARTAIKILWKAGQLAEENECSKVQKKHVDIAKAELEEKRIMDAIENSGTNQKRLMYSILDLRKRDHILAGQVYERYEKLGKTNDYDPVSQRQCRKLVNKLDMKGLISIKVVNRGRRGRTREIELEIEEDSAEMIENRLEDQFYIDA
jgi:cell division control protein 6